MTKWLPFELHCHTFHSDGKQSLAELVSAAHALGLRGVALTDHNTMTGLANREQIVAESGVEVIPGLEWTTFFGHMLTLGIQEYVDWRNLSPFHIHRGIDGVHRQGGLVGVAHPFRVGSPMCTGCFWEFEVSDWNEVDYIEVWSGLFPSIQRNNARAFAMWTELLNRGHRIAATSGRDWHVSDPVTDPISATFLGIQDEAVEDDGLSLVHRALDALRRGNVAVSMGPLPQLSVLGSDGTRAGIGDTIELREGDGMQLEVTAGIDFTARAGHWELPEQLLQLKLVSNLGELAVVELTQGQPQADLTLDVTGVRWLRGELYGVFCNVRTMIGFTNAIYFS
ncbi:CehA/McbA family metallohydrolase [Paenibacillus radicis (ex Xue et al. 2023)]|uniref:CehA/McbA family metallohydrolase n=1 Tax=Paenibacillus radicis (ex Xue et al. 2023) TaxID=2972489 RepID=A0ABT1YPB6_9BACL|nr:CehA/McbA family metallohydrolase [Paenibacillus radicis (ex Xue et al. 2023)]MCR8635020.1 CehA/McbA family metallohydrolase [Paenibacillus radicis (ex Xue et al. 2023)]